METKYTFCYYANGSVTLRERTRIAISNANDAANTQDNPVGDSIISPVGGKAEHLTNELESIQF